MRIPDFKYIIIGAGTSGLHLINSIVEDQFFRNKGILVIDKSLKQSKNKCFSFWEKGNGKWDKIISKSWSLGEFISSKGKVSFTLEDYKYKMIKSNDFYNYIKKSVSKYDNVQFIEDEILNIRLENNKVVVVGNNSNYICDHAFDSRITKNNNDSNNGYISLKQHFKGWIIKTSKPKFNPNLFTIMDYTIRDIDETAFTYILPISEDKALVKYIYFTSELADSIEYDNKLNSYIKNILKIKKFKILDEEVGIIPMRNFPFYKENNKHITKIGTAGEWVKLSTGYSFKNVEKNCKKIVEELKKKNPYIKLKSPYKYYYYDKLFLYVLNKYNFYGENMFYKIFKRNNIKKIFKFLDEESNLIEDISIFISMFSLKYIRVVIASIWIK